MGTPFLRFIGPLCDAGLRPPLAVFGNIAALTRISGPCGRAAMNAYLWASLGAIIGLLPPLLYLRRRQRLTDAGGHGDDAPAVRGSRPAAPVTSKPRLPSNFHAVTLKPCLEPCDAVQAIAGQRFLSREAPALPLAGCDQQRCDCTYAHWSDRREEGERRSGWERLGGLSHALVKGNRREHEGDRRNQT